jgi:hypothetical protein
LSTKNDLNQLPSLYVYKCKVSTPIKPITPERIKTKHADKIKSNIPPKKMGKFKVVTDGLETPGEPSPSHTANISRSAHLAHMRFSVLNLNHMTRQTMPLREIMWPHHLRISYHQSRRKRMAVRHTRIGRHSRHGGY